MLTDEELGTAARFLTVKPQARVEDVVNFVNEKFGKRIKCDTLRKLLKRKHGFIRADFRAIPVKRNSLEAKEQRTRYAEMFLDRFRELEKNAVFIDESGWTKDNRPFKGWTFKGIRPSLPWDVLSPKQISTIAAISPIHGLVHVEYECQTVDSVVL